MKWNAFIISFAILFIFYSCQLNDDVEDILEIQNNEVHFITDIKTKGVDLTNSNIDNIGVLAFYTGRYNWVDVGSVTSPYFMYNSLLNRVKTNNAWSNWNYSPLVYWPNNDEKISFFAYSPFANKNNNIRISEIYKTGLPNITYQIPTDVTKQVDLLYTLPVLDLNKSDVLNNFVKLNFKHSLSKIVFNARLKRGGEPTNGDYLKVESVELSSLFDSGVLSFNETPNIQAVWTPKTTKKSYSVRRGNGVKDFRLNSDYNNITDENGILFLLPQNLTQTSEIIVKYALYNKNGYLLKNYQSSNIIYSLIQNFPMGKAVNFNIELGLDNPGVINAGVNDWDEMFVEGNFAATYLNISRTNIQEYQGKTITVYFETDYEGNIFLTCIKKPYNQPSINLTPSNGVITFPNNLKPGKYEFRLKAGGLSQIIHLNIISNY